jgi:hypothetical protein
MSFYEPRSGASSQPTAEAVDINIERGRQPELWSASDGEGYGGRACRPVRMPSEIRFATDGGTRLKPQRELVFRNWKGIDSISSEASAKSLPPTPLFDGPVAAQVFSLLRRPRRWPVGRCSAAQTFSSSCVSPQTPASTSEDDQNNRVGFDVAHQSFTDCPWSDEWQRTRSEWRRNEQVCSA